jgi:importin-5
MSPDHTKRFIVHLQEQLESYLVRNRQRQIRRKEADYEPEDEEALQDEEFSDDTFLGDASGTISALFKVFGASFLPYFDELLPKFAEFSVVFILFVG